MPELAERRIGTRHTDIAQTSRVLRHALDRLREVAERDLGVAASAS